MTDAMPAGPTLLQPPLPRRLQVEVTGSCNLRCRMCIVRYRPALGRTASMSFEEFRRLLGELPDVNEVVLQGIGEPLMAPDIFKMVEYCGRHGIDVGFNSNGTLLTRYASKRLIDGGLNWLCISLDGASAETYEFVRDQAKLAQVERNVTGLIALQREQGAINPRLSLVMVLMRRNLHELPDIVARAAGWGIPQVFVQGLSHDFSDAPTDAYAAIAEYVGEQSVDTVPRLEIEAVYAEANALAAREGIDLRLPPLKPHHERVVIDGVIDGGVTVGCDWPWRGSYVTYDGTVKPCCMVMGSERAAVGSLKQHSFAAIWTNEGMQRFREGLTNGKPDPVCAGCSLYHGRF